MQLFLFIQFYKIKISREIIFDNNNKMFNLKLIKMNLENLNLVELNAQEVKEIEGGIGGTGVMEAFFWIKHQVKDLVNGFNDGLND